MGEFSNNATVASSDCEMKIFQAELPILLLVSAIANLVAMVTQVRMLHSLKSKNMWLLILLTGNDLFMSVVLLTSIIVNTVTCNRFHANRLCDLLGWLGAGSFSLSIFLILAINMERFLMIVFPLFHHKHVTPVRIAILFFVGEFLALVPLGLPLVGVGSPYLYYANNKLCLFDFSAWETNNPTHAKLILINSLYMILLILLVTAANIATIRRLHRRNTHIQTHTHRIHSMGNTIRMAKRFSLLIKVVAFVNCICTMPFFVSIVHKGPNLQSLVLTKIGAK